MDADAPVTVLRGILATSAAGASAGAAYAVAKRQSPLVFAVNSSVNSGIAGLTFFALREYVAGPALVQTMPWQTYVRRREALLAGSSGRRTSSPAHMSSSEMRSHKLLDTAIAGAATGGILNTFKRGVPGFLPGVITAGLVCTTAQGLLNELNVARVKYISRSDALRHDGPAAPPERVRSFSEKLMDGLGVVLPVKKITDDEYLQMLLREREEVERRLEVVRKELNDVEEESGS